MKQPFDAVVVDLVMVGQSGIELGIAVKRLNRSTPVILVTAYPQVLKDSPFDLMLPKPFPHCVLRAALDLFCA
jgi:CheY-like chemotaxis protein